MSAAFSHRRELLSLAREAALYRLPSWCTAEPADLSDKGPPLRDWNNIFAGLDTQRAEALAVGDHEAVLLVDVVRILVNLRWGGDKRRRFETVFRFLVDELARDCGAADGPDPC